MSRVPPDAPMVGRPGPDGVPVPPERAWSSFVRWAVGAPLVAGALLAVLALALWLGGTGGSLAGLVRGNAALRYGLVLLAALYPVALYFWANELVTALRERRLWERAGPRERDLIEAENRARLAGRQGGRRA